jgi:hypothetical protein
MSQMIMSSISLLVCHSYSPQGSLPGAFLSCIFCFFYISFPHIVNYCSSLSDHTVIFIDSYCNGSVGYLFNHLTPNGHFSGRTAPQIYRCCIFLFIQQIYVLNIFKMLHSLRFLLFKMSFIS